MSWWLAGGISASDCVAAYQAEQSASLAASLVNLNNPGISDATAPVPPLFTSRQGWVFNGSTQYTRLPLVPTEAWSLFVKFNNLVPTLAGNYLLGYFSNLAPRGSYAMLFDTSAVTCSQGSSGNAAYNPPTMTSGNYGFAAQTIYRNGIVEPDTAAGNGTGGAMYVGALNFSGTAFGFTAVEVCAIGVYSVGLSQAQITALVQAMAQITPSVRGHANISNHPVDVTNLGQARRHVASIGDKQYEAVKVASLRQHIVKTFDHHGGVS